MFVSDHISSYARKYFDCEKCKFMVFNLGLILSYSTVKLNMLKLTAQSITLNVTYFSDPVATHQNC